MIKQITYFFTFLYFFTNAHTLLAQHKGIFVIDSLNKVPVCYIMAQNQERTFRQQSDQNGFISLANFPQNSSVIILMGVGFQTKTIDMSTLDLNQKNIIYLQETISSISEIVVESSNNNGIFKTISDLDIHLRPINNSQEVLRMVPGLFIGQHAGGGKAEQIFLRGFDIDHGTDINISVDGMPVNMVSHAHGQGYADLHFVIPELIEAVNFNKGPYFAQKGNFTTAGFVEFQTKKFLEKNFFKLEAGQFNTFRGITGVNLLTNKGEKRTQSLYFAGEGSFTKGYFDSPQDFGRLNGMLKYHSLLNEKHSLTASLTGFSSQWDASGQIPNRAVENGLIGFYGAIDDKEGGKTSRYNANVELASYLNNGAVLSNQVFYSKYLFELYSNFTFFKEDPVNGDQIKQKENRNLWGYNSLYQHEYHLGRLKTETQAGIQIRYDDIKDIELSRTKNKNENLNSMMFGDVQELNAGAFYSQKLSLNHRWNITGAIRFDYFYNQYNDKLISETQSAHSNILSPKLNFHYRHSDQVQLYLLNGRGYHSNDTRVAVPQAGKKVLPPAYGTDLGGIFKIGKKLVAQSAVWYLWLDQEFVYVGDEGVVEAGGQTRRFGLDISLRYEIVKNLYADVDISLANPKALGVNTEESYLPLAPRFTSVGGITYRKQKGWNGSLRYRYMADRPANETNSVVAQGYFVTDGAINYTTPKWEVGISAQNLFNTQWKETQFDTESQLQTETNPVSEIHFTPGTPFFTRLNLAFFF